MLSDSSKSGVTKGMSLPQRETQEQAAGAREVAQWVWAVAVMPDDLVEGKTDSWKLSSELHT